MTTYIDDSDDYYIKDLIGLGSFGRIYKCQHKNGEISAMKTTTVSETYGIRNMKEIDIMSKYLHDNIASGRNCRVILEEIDDDTKISFSICSDMAYSNLYTYIIGESCSFQVKDIILIDIARGLEFLHHNGYIHADLKPENILIYKNNNDIVAKICDFGNSLYIGHNKSFNSSRELTTKNYRAPEILRKPDCLTFDNNDSFRSKNMTYTCSTDIWAYGINMVFVITGMKWDNSFFNQTRQSIIDLYFPSGRPYLQNILAEYIKNRDIGIYLDILSKILVIDPELRPTSNQLLTSPEYLPKLNSCVRPFNNPIIISPNVIPVEYVDSILYRGFDFMLRTGLHLNVKTETFFLAGDIYQRTIHLLDIFSEGNPDIFEENNIAWKNLSCLSLCCLWISLKIVEETYLTSDNIIILASKLFDQDLVLTMEQNIIESLDGILYRPNLYTLSSGCYQHLIDSFKELYNCFSYNQLDFQNHHICNQKICNSYPISNKFIDFFKETEYYRYSNGNLYPPNSDYVFLMYQSDYSTFLNDHI